MNKKIYFPEIKADLTLFVGDKNINTVKYGLPLKVEFCKKCLITNQRPTTRAEHTIKKDIPTTTNFFDGICEACIIKEKHKNIDWEKKEHEFTKILDKYRSRNGNYDVVVPGSGGKDSFFVAHQLKYKYKMNSKKPKTPVSTNHCK